MRSNASGKNIVSAPIKMMRSFTVKTTAQDTDKHRYLELANKIGSRDRRKLDSAKRRGNQTSPTKMWRSVFEISLRIKILIESTYVTLSAIAAQILQKLLSVTQDLASHYRACWLSQGAPFSSATLPSKSKIFSLEFRVLKLTTR